MKNEILRLYLSGDSQENIANKLNISVGTVNNHVSEILKSDDTIDLQRQIAIVAKKILPACKQTGYRDMLQEKVKRNNKAVHLFYWSAFPCLSFSAKKAFELEILFHSCCGQKKVEIPVYPICSFYFF